MGKKRREQRSLSRSSAVRGNREGGQTISLCMIVKDEETNLAKCLESVRGLVDEILVVDTGSSDRTAEIAQEMGARVLHFAWIDNFAAARNHAIQNATGSWVLQLDADEELDRSTSRSLRSFVARIGSRLGCFRLPVVNLVGNGDRPTTLISYQRRLFRRRPDVIRYVGLIHEQVQCLSGDHSWTLETTDEVRIVHYGYLSQAYHEKGKHGRNFPLLFKALNQDPLNPQHHFNIALQFMTLGDKEKAIYHHREGLRLFNPSAAPNDLVITACTQVVEHYYQAEHYEEALASVRAIVSRTSNPDLHYWVGRCWLALDKLDEAQEHFQRAVAARGGHHTQFVEGSDSWLPIIGLMDCALRCGDHARARRLCPQAQEHLPESRTLALRAELLQALRQTSAPKRDVTRLADSLAQAGDLEAAVIAYALALEEGSSGELLRKRGLALHRQRRYLLAARDFEAALREDSADADAAFWLGQAKVSLERTEEARDALRLCLRLKPAYYDACRALFRLEVKEGEDEEALSYGLRAAYANETDEELWGELAACYRRLGRLQDAYDLLSSRADRSPANRAVVSPMVELLREHHEHEAALSVLWRAIEGNQDEATFYLLLGGVLGELGRYEDALNAYEIAAAKDPDLPVLSRAKEVILALSSRLAGSGMGRSTAPVAISSPLPPFRANVR